MSTTPQSPKMVRNTRILAGIAAVLAFAAVILRYTAERRIDWIALAGGVFMILFMLTVGRKR